MWLQLAGKRFNVLIGFYNRAQKSKGIIAWGLYHEFSWQSFAQAFGLRAFANTIWAFKDNKFHVSLPNVVLVYTISQKEKHPHQINGGGVIR